MEFLILIVFAVVILAMVGNAAEKNAQVMQKEIVKDIKKVCPPHKWFHQEIKDHEGVTHAWKMVCEHCGPLRPQGPPPKTDY